MIHDLKPHRQYRATGLSWLEELPTHWEVRRNGGLFEQRREMGFPDLPILEVSLRTGVRIRDLENSTNKQVISDRSTYQRACCGDLAYNMMRMWQGAVGVAPVDGLISPAYVVARPYPSTNSRYYSYLFRTSAYMDQVDAYSRGIVKDRNRLYWDGFKQIPSPCPPLEEQTAIVRFLNHTNQRFNRLIRTKRRLIALLNEQKQGVIHGAVTAGVARHTEFKSTNLPWADAIPSHWDIRPLKQFAKVQTGLTLGKTYGKAILETRPYLRVANVQDGRLDLGDVAFVQVPPYEVSACELRSGDVLMTEGGDPDKLGRGCLWRGEVAGCLHQNHVFAVRVYSSELTPEFLVLLMSSRHGRTYFQRTSKQTTNLASTNSTTLKAFPLIVPPVAEQELILRYVSDEGAAINLAISRALREISLIEEYRVSLIADTVTGKLDVRQVAATLPEFDDVTELIGETRNERSDELDLEGDDDTGEGT